MDGKRSSQIWFWAILAMIMAVLVIEPLLVQPPSVKTIPYSEFQRLAAKGELTNLVIGKSEITGSFKAPADKNVTDFVTYRVDPALAQQLAKEKLTFTGKAEPELFATVLAWLIPMMDLPWCGCF
jgi:cell division protease FtsH